MTLHDRIRAAVEERLAEVKAARLRLLSAGPKYWTPAGRGAQYGLWVGDHSVGTVELDSADHLRLLSLIDPADAILAAEHALGILDAHRPANGMAEPDPLGEYCTACSRLTQNGYPYPCDEIRRLATRWRVEVDG